MLEQNFTKLRSLCEEPYVCDNHSAKVLVTLVGFVTKKNTYKILDWIGIVKTSVASKITFIYENNQKEFKKKSSYTTSPLS